MELLFSGKVFEILPTSNGIVFSYLNREFENGDIEVSYKMISLDSRRITDVAKNVYMVTKFGNNYKSVEKYCENYIMSKSIVLPGSRVFLLHEDGQAQLIDANGELIWSGLMVYKNLNPSDMILFADGLWACYEKGDFLVRYSLNNMKEDLRIGGKNSPFEGPCALFEEDGLLGICNKNSKKIMTLNVADYSVLEYETFEEPLEQYVNLDGYRFVILESGLYVM